MNFRDKTPENTVLAEYLYVDERRLNSYFEQISLPVKYEKVSTLGFELSLTGPKASGSQSKQSRAFTTHEKLRAVFENIISTSQKLSAEDRWHAPFQFETLSGFRAYIPPKASKKGTFKGLPIWFLRDIDAKPGDFSLYLIEDFPGKDVPREGFSGRSALWMLLNETAAKVLMKGKGGLKKQPEVVVGKDYSFYETFAKSNGQSMAALLGQALQDAGVSVSTALSIGTMSTLTSSIRVNLNDGIKRYTCYVDKPDNVSKIEGVTTIHFTRDLWMEVAARFAADPMSLMDEWGADVGPEQQVDALFKIRHTMIENSVPGFRASVIGYPIFIAEHPSPFVTK